MSEPIIFRIEGISTDIGLRGLVGPEYPEGLNQGTIHLPTRSIETPDGVKQQRCIGFERRIRVSKDVEIPWKAPAFLSCTITDAMGMVIVDRHPVPAPALPEEITESETVALLSSRIPAYQVPFPADLPPGEYSIRDEINPMYGSGSHTAYIKLMGEDYGILPTFTLHAS